MGVAAFLASGMLATPVTAAAAWILVASAMLAVRLRGASEPSELFG